MITTADILALPAIHEWELLAGAPDALQRRVINLGIMDAAVGKDAYADYVPGEFILSNMGFARDDADLAERSLATMVSRDLAAVAVRNVHELPISQRVLDASNASGTPLFLYRGEYYEQVIFQGMKLLERDCADADIAHLIDGLLRNRTPEQTRQVFYEALRATGATIQCAVLQPTAADEASLYAQIDDLVSVTDQIRRTWERVETASVFRYHDCAIMVITYNRPPAAFQMESDSEFIQLLRPYGRIVCGISEEVPLGQGDLAVREAFGALGAARAQGDTLTGDTSPGRNRTVLRWADMRVGAFRDAAAQDRLITSTCQLYQQMLANHDEQHGSDLLATARALADTVGDVRAAAETLFQHPNTVRYRLRKLKVIFNMEDATDRELTRFLMLVFLT